MIPRIIKTTKQWTPLYNQLKKIKTPKQVSGYLSPPLNNIRYNLVIWKVDFTIEYDVIARHGSDVVRLRRVRGVAGN